MKIKYTSGPWVVEKSGNILWIGPNGHRTDGKVEDIVTHIELDSGYKRGKKNQRKADANLISAAPELLETLIEIIREEWGIELDAEPEGHSRIAQKALAIIKKATSVE